MQNGVGLPRARSMHFVNIEDANALFGMDGIELI